MRRDVATALVLGVVFIAIYTAGALVDRSRHHDNRPCAAAATR
jgi:hypothetical protein